VLFLVLLCACPPVGAQPPPIDVLSVATAADGDHVIFVVEIARPSDMATMTIERSSWQSVRTPWPRMAELRSAVPWECPCYLSFSRAEPWLPVPRLDRLKFVGRCRPVESLTLLLRYPLSSGGYAERTVELDLAQAAALPADPPARQRFGAAQAEWFSMLGEHTGDYGGFFAFAAQQTRRQYDLPPAEEWRRPWRAPEQAEELLYNISTGALAVQESLQLDRMTATDRDRGSREIPAGDIPAVSTRSHPFDRMRGEKQPTCSDLPRLVPENFYYLRFANVAKLLELLDLCDRWGGSLLRLPTPVGADYGIRERFHRQLCLPHTVLARLLGPAVIGELAVIGSDPYVQEGTDVTALFKVKRRELFDAAVNMLFEQARRSGTDLVHDTVTYRGIAIERLVDPFRRVSCHRCWLGDVCAYSNSLVALQKVIHTQAGDVPNLAAAADFQYMRAVVFPLESQSEDGFLYLSDAFIRRLVGPELRINEKRRLEAITSLKMIANAALFHGWTQGPGQPTLDDLIAGGSLEREDLLDPGGGTFSWDAVHGVARSSTYGDLRFLTPLIEIDIDRVTAKEREQYERFRDRYQQYWRQYFDPIGVRIRVDRTIALDTCILPLIDLSEYDQFEDLTGGEPVEFQSDRFTRGTLLRVIMHLNDGMSKQQALAFLSAVTGTNLASDWVGDWVTIWIEDSEAFNTLVRNALREPSEDEDDLGRTGREVLDVFNAPLVVGIHVKNKLSLAAFLVALRAFIQNTAPNMVVFNNLEPYQGITMVQIAPDPSGELAREVLGTQPTSQAATQALVSERGPAIYYAAIGDGFYVSTQADVLRRLIDQQQALSSAPAAGEALRANLGLYVAPVAAELARPGLTCLLEHRAHNVSLRNMGQVWLLGRAGILGQLPLDEAACNYLGYRLVCPDGGLYRYDSPAGDVTCSLHGRLSQPTRLDDLPEDSPFRQLLDELQTAEGCLRFTEEGVATTVKIRRR